jgi:hypothetical protein
MLNRFISKPMHFWRKEYFQTLKDIAADAAAVPEWVDYAAFCSQYERGLRGQAFAILERFLSSMERAKFADRRRFVSWLMQRADGREGRHMLVPHPLQVRVVEPTLLEWTVVEPGSSEPHRWLGGYDHLKRAIELQPDDTVARRKFVVFILGRVGFATHELPIGFIGAPTEGLTLLEEAETALRGLLNDDLGRFAQKIAENRALILEYLSKR